MKDLITSDLRRQTECYFESVDLRIMGGKQPIKLCRELENSSEVHLFCNLELEGGRLIRNR
jgi:hypothetical protein